MRRTFLTAILLSLATILPADDSFGLVLGVTGEGFSVYRDGTRTFYNVEDAQSGPIVLEGADLVQTEVGTFLDVQLIPGMGRARIAGFSTVGMAIGESDTLFSMDLVYGRLLVDADDPVAVTSHGTLVSNSTSPTGDEAEATFGVDYVAERAVASIPVSLIYVTEGAVRVGDEEGMQLRDGDMVRAARIRRQDGAVDLVLETDAVEFDILDFWAENGFAFPALTAKEVAETYPSLRPRIADWLGEEAQPVVEAIPEAGVAEVDRPEPPEVDAASSPVEPTRDEVLDQAIPRALRPEIRTVDYTGAKKFFRGTALSTISVGLVAEGIGLVLLFASDVVAPNLDAGLANTVALGLTIGGGASIGTGLLSYILSNVLGSGSQ